MTWVHHCTTTFTCCFVIGIFPTGIRNSAANCGDVLLCFFFGFDTALIKVVYELTPGRKQLGTSAGRTVALSRAPAPCKSQLK